MDLLHYVPVFALSGGGETGNSIVTSMSTAFTTAVTDIMSAITTILPIVLPVVGAIAVVTIGIRIFRKVTGR